VTRFAGQCVAVARRDLAVQRTYGVSALLGMLSAVLGLVAYHYIGRLIGPGQANQLAGGSFFAFVWTGIMAQTLVAATLGALAGALAREAHEGTLEPSLAAGASPLALVLGAAAAPALLAGLQIAIHTSVSVPGFGLDLSRARPLPFLAALVGTVAACAPIGLVGAATWLLLRRPGAVVTVALFAFGVVGGIYFPVTLLPEPVASLAGWVPLAVGLTAMRAALLDGAGFAETASALARLALLCAVGFPPALWLLRAAFRRALRRGTLSLV
jgi:ABC-2 type transport system permease protein